MLIGMYINFFSFFFNFFLSLSSIQSFTSFTFFFTSLFSPFSDLPQTGWMMWNWTASALACGTSVLCYDGSPLKPRDSTLFDIVQQDEWVVRSATLMFNKKWFTCITLDRLLFGVHGSVLFTYVWSTCPYIYIISISYIHFVRVHLIFLVN